MDDIKEYNRLKTGKEIEKELWDLSNKSLVSFRDVDGIYYDAGKDGTADGGIIFNDIMVSGPIKMESSDDPRPKYAQTGYIATIELVQG